MLKQGKDSVNEFFDGTVNISVLNQAQNELIQSNLTYMISVIDTQSSFANLNFAAGNFDNYKEEKWSVKLSNPYPEL